MFRTKSRTERAADQARAHAVTIKDQAGGLSERVRPTVSQARAASAHAAEQAKDWASPHAEVARDWASPRVGAARDWASPRLEKARERGVEVAAPRVEQAADALAPRVDATRDKIVDELLPRLVEAVAAAAAVAAAKTDEARDASHEALGTVSKQAKKKQRSGRKRKALVVLGIVGAAAGAGYAAWRRGQPTDDPWATETATGSSSTSPSGPRLGGGDASGGLGAGSLASQSADVDTPVPDGEQVSAGGGPALDSTAESGPTSGRPANTGLADGSAEKALDDTGTAEIPGVPATGDESSLAADGSPMPDDGRRSAGGGAAKKD